MSTMYSLRLKWSAIEATTEIADSNDRIAAASGLG
jgi:hypothetical protein